MTNEHFIKKNHKGKCRNCKVKVSSMRPRGLCFYCYRNIDIRNRFSISKYANRGVSNGNGTYILDDTPTDTRPGSADRIAVYERRAASDKLIFHPDDSYYEDDGMLILSRKIGEKIKINDDITIVILSIYRGKVVKIGIEASPEVIVNRQEIPDYQRPCQRNEFEQPTKE